MVDRMAYVEIEFKSGKPKFTVELSRVPSLNDYIRIWGELFRVEYVEHVPSGAAGGDIADVQVDARIVVDART